MALLRADTEPGLGGRRPSPGLGTVAGAGPTVTLAVTLALGGFTALLCVALLVVHPDPTLLITRLTVQQDQSAKTALYLLGFAVVTPACGLVGVRVADAIARGPNAEALAGLSAVVAGGLAAVLIAAKVSSALPWGDGLAVVLVGVGLWAAATAGALFRATRPRRWAALRVLEGRGDAATAAAAGLAFLAVLCFTHLSALDLVILAALSAVAFTVLVRVRPRAVPHLGRPWGPAVDLLTVAVLLLAIPDVVVFTTTGALPNVFAPPGIVQFHHDFLLGPTNQVLHGGTLLVDSPVSQYGVGTVYFLAAWFHVAPIGYGTYGLLDGLLTAGFFAAGYAALRVAGVSRLLAVPALVVAVVAFVWALDYPIGSLPQQGPLRFGLPMLLILATTAALRWPLRARPARVAGFAVVGLSSVWALEAFAFTAMTLVALLLAQAALRPAGTRRGWLARQAALAAGACLAAHVLLAAATLAASGSLPHWGQYLAYLRAFLGGGKAGELTYGFEPWSPGLPVAAGYAASAVALVVLLRRRPVLAAQHPVQLVALAGFTAYGVALFSYAQNRSSTYLLPYVALPALLAGVLWVGLALRAPAEAPRSLRVGGVALTLGTGVVLLLSALPVGSTASRSALAHAHPGGGLRGALARLRDAPPIDPRAPEGVRLLDRYLPGQSHVLVLLPKSPELEVEILMRSRRANRLPVGNPVEESFVPSVWAPPLRRAIADLQPGSRILVDRATLGVLASLRARPGFDPLADPQIGGDALEEWILREIGRRFDLRPVATGAAGLLVAELSPRPA